MKDALDWTVQNREAGTRLGQFLKSRLLQSPETRALKVSMRVLKKALERGLGSVNGQVERYASLRLDAGHRVRLRIGGLKTLIEESQQTRAELGDEHILHLDKECVVLDKPAGLSVSDSDGPHSLPRALEQLCKRQRWKPLHLAHRLDRDTSGTLILCRRKEHCPVFFEMFRNRQVKKCYEAVVQGRIKDERGQWDSFLTEIGQSGGQVKWGVVSKRKTGGKKRSKAKDESVQALTTWQCLARGDDRSHLRLFPVTGRTHQLRVQSASAGHPIVGDSLYGYRPRGGPPALRHMLHARGLIFKQPISGAMIQVEAPLPEDFQQQCP